MKTHPLKYDEDIEKYYLRKISEHEDVQKTWPEILIIIPTRKALEMCNTFPPTDVEIYDAVKPMMHIYWQKFKGYRVVLNLQP